MNQIVDEAILEKFDKYLTDLIYDYLCFFREDKTTLPRAEVVKTIRDCTHSYIKHCLDMVLVLNQENK